MHRRDLLVALAALLAGCSTDPGTDTAASTTTRPPTTATPTATPTATSTATPTATSTATSTPSSTATPSPTATPAPEVETGTVGEWVAIQTQGTTLEVQLTRSRVTETLSHPQGSLDAPDGETWVIGHLWFRVTDSQPATLSRDQWSLEDFRGESHSTHGEAMRKATDTLPERTELGAYDGVRYRVIFAVQYPEDVTFEMAPYDSSDGPTVQLVP